MASPSTPSERTAAALVGCFVADAASMPLHWIYDVEKLKATVGDAEPLFFDTLSCPFYTAKDFPGHYAAAGDLSPYGEQALATLMLTRQIVSKDGSGVANAPLDGDTFAKKFSEWTGSYTGREDHMLKGFKENIANGAKYPECGADDDQAQSFGKLATIASVFEGSEHMLSSIEVAVRALQNNQLNVDTTQFLGRMLQAVVAGQSIKTAYEVAKAGMPADGQETLRTAIARVEANLSKSTHAMLMEYGAELDPKFAAIGLACPNPQAFMGSIHVLLNATSFEDGVRMNLLTAGDNCSRATCVGAVLGAAFGVPNHLAEKLSPAVREQLNAY